MLKIALLMLIVKKVNEKEQLNIMKKPLISTVVLPKHILI